MKRRFSEETQKLKFAVADVSNLQATRQAAEALNVWQPEVVRGRHKQLVEQCTVPFEYRKNSVEMEIKLCRQQIAGLDKAIVATGMMAKVTRLLVKDEAFLSVDEHLNCICSWEKWPLEEKAGIERNYGNVTITNIKPAGQYVLSFCKIQLSRGF